MLIAVITLLVYILPNVFFSIMFWGGGGGGWGAALGRISENVVSTTTKKEIKFCFLEWGNVRWEMLHEHFPTHCNRSVMVQMSVL